MYFTDTAFYSACRYGLLELAKWLFLKKKINIFDAKIAFRAACYNGHLNTVEWLYDTFKGDFDAIYLQTVLIKLRKSKQKDKVSKVIDLISNYL